MARRELALGWGDRCQDPAWRGNGRVVIPLAQQEVEAPRPVAVVLLGSVLNHGFPRYVGGRAIRPTMADQAVTRYMASAQPHYRLAGMPGRR